VERVGAIAQILRTEPTHFGAAHQLLISLRQGGAFADREPPGGRSNHPTSPVPRKIVQFWDQPEIPGDILHGMLSWPQQCLGFEHQIFNDASAHAFIQRTCDKTVAKAYRQANHPAMRADIFRLAYLAVEGGIYADADDICRRSVGDLLSPNVELVLVQEDLGSIGNNFICVRPEHPFIAAALEQVVTQVLKKQQNIIWFLTGPGAMTQRFCLYFLDVLAAGELPQRFRFWISMRCNSTSACICRAHTNGAPCIGLLLMRRPYPCSCPGNPGRKRCLLRGTQAADRHFS